MKSQKPKSLIVGYLKHLAIAWPGVFVAGFLSAVILQFHPWMALFDFPNSAPFFAGYVLLGAAAGYFFARRDGSRAALWVWIPAIVLFADGVHGWTGMIVGGGWAGVWTDFFSKNCAGSECLNEVLMTAPLYATVAYSLAALAALRRRAAQNPNAKASIPGL